MYYEPPRTKRNSNGTNGIEKEGVDSFFFFWRDVGWGGSRCRRPSNEGADPLNFIFCSGTLREICGFMHGYVGPHFQFGGKLTDLRRI